ncbi:MAG: tRNA dihydrouridine synthase DusB [Pseudomonadales bacterium]|nr:tRNA dihydrouridine synthase DusB [Pseudomonadales bacterium]
MRNPLPDHQKKCHLAHMDKLPKIGPYQLVSPVLLAPMAGITDRPFRQLVMKMGAGLATSEMITSKVELWNSRKTQQRLLLPDDNEPRSIQIVGNDPELMAQAAKLNAQQGAQIIDINMGCPAKKVCKKAAGSALMRDEKLIAEILDAVVKAVNIPVTLKTRTGWTEDKKNALSIAKIAEDCGIQAIAIHGRTGASRFTGTAEYDTVAEVKSKINIPVFANGDITTPKQAKVVLEYTGCDAIMVGRGSQGQPWLLGEISYFLKTGQLKKELSVLEKGKIAQNHIRQIHDHYGERIGVRIARKHLAWYAEKALASVADFEQSKQNSHSFVQSFHTLTTADDQNKFIENIIKNIEPPKGAAA